jgi:hypothetical protein
MLGEQEEKNPKSSSPKINFFFSKLMIKDYGIKCNTYHEKILKNYSIFDYKCPKCTAKHRFIRHGQYTRNIFYLRSCNKAGYTLVEEKIIIQRLKCTSCNSTHAVFPQEIIPYRIVTLDLIFFFFTNFI